MKLADGTATSIARYPLPRADWQTTIVNAMDRLKSWTPETPVFAYSETALSCDLHDRAPLSRVAPGDRPLEGRLFDETGELRWVAREDGTFDAWVLVAQADGCAEAEPVIQVERTYYLVGRGTTTPGEFREGRYTGKVFKYPADAPGGKPELARAYIRVFEYYRLPDWNRAAGDVDAIERLLNEPMLVAHRFVDVGVAS